MARVRSIAAALVVVWFLGCQPTRAEPARPAGRAPDAGGGASVDTSPAGPTAEDVIATLAVRKMWPLPLDAVERRLALLGPWKQVPFADGMLDLKGAASSVVRTAEVSFGVPEGGKPWFMGANFELQVPFAACRKLIEARLGKPAWTRNESNPPARMASWNLGRRITIGIHDGGSADRTAISISEPQGEAD